MASALPTSRPRTQWARHHPRERHLQLPPPATDKAEGSPSTGPKADADAQDKPMDMTPPWLGVIFWSPPAPHKAVGSTTASLNEG